MREHLDFPLGIRSLSLRDLSPGHQPWYIASTVPADLLPMAHLGPQKVTPRHDKPLILWRVGGPNTTTGQMVQMGTGQTWVSKNLKIYLCH
jgi:hypothetical protein